MTNKKESFINILNIFLLKQPLDIFMTKKVSNHINIYL